MRTERERETETETETKGERERLVPRDLLRCLLLGVKVTQFKGPVEVTSLHRAAFLASQQIHEATGASFVVTFDSKPSHAPAPAEI